MKAITLILSFICCMALTMPAAHAQDVDVTITANAAPPELPQYDQPPCPVENYMWVPGYWAYQPANGYYWVPGVWVAAPEPGYLWTPAYWSLDDGVYTFHAGYWGVHIGFYGGVNYGYGYDGDGYVGGRWENDHFRYNTAVVTVNTTVIHNVYVDNTVVHNTTVINRASFNGRGGIEAHASREQMEAMHERHLAATSEQFSHQQMASHDRNQFERFNRGHPVSAAMNHPGGTAVREQPRGDSRPGVAPNRNAAGNPGEQPNAYRNPGAKPGNPTNPNNANRNPIPNAGRNPNVARNPNTPANPNGTPGANPNTQVNANHPANNPQPRQVQQQQPRQVQQQQPRQVQQQQPRQVQQPRQQPQANNAAQKQPKKH